MKDSEHLTRERHVPPVTSEPQHSPAQHCEYFRLDMSPGSLGVPAEGRSAAELGLEPDSLTAASTAASQPSSGCRLGVAGGQRLRGEFEITSFLSGPFLVV